VARIGQLFHRNATGQDHDRVHDRDRDGVDDRVEMKERFSTDRTDRLPAAGSLDADTDRDGIAARRETHTAGMRPVIDREPATVPDVTAPRETTPGETAPVKAARTSVLALLGLVVGVVAVGTALTGLLATWAIPLGAIGLLLSFTGIISGARRHVAGRGPGTLGVLLSGTAVVFGILALTGQVSWLDSDVDQVARLNGWLDATFPWAKDW
jgi:hypothetical protein